MAPKAAADTFRNERRSSDLSARKRSARSSMCFVSMLLTPGILLNVMASPLSVRPALEGQGLAIGQVVVAEGAALRGQLPLARLLGVVLIREPVVGQREQKRDELVFLVRGQCQGLDSPV